MEFLYLETKMTEIQTGHSSLSANNSAEMLQKEPLSYAIKADVFIMCFYYYGLLY